MKAVRLFPTLLAQRSGKMAAVVLGVVIALGVLAPWLAIADPAAIDLGNKFADPSRQHWLGTDNLGRDVLSRLIWGARSSLLTALAITALTVAFGALYEGISTAADGRTDAFMMRLCDMWMSFPSEVLILGVVGMLGPGLSNIVIACFAAKWPWYARLLRTISRRIRSKGYVSFALASGADSRWIFWRHMLPNMAGEICVIATLDVGSVLLMVSSLSFLGLGVMPPGAEWGMMLAEAKDVLTLHPWQMVPPGVMILLCVTSLHFLGDALAAALLAGEGRS